MVARSTGVSDKRGRTSGTRRRLAARVSKSRSTSVSDSAPPTSARTWNSVKHCVPSPQKPTTSRTSSGWSSARDASTGCWVRSWGDHAACVAQERLEG